jgi:hypothetical protein
MDNGYVIIGIIALLFLSMYGYVYASIAFENIKGKKAKKKLVKLREERRVMKLSNQIKRDEKLAKLLKRSEEIRQELRELELNKDLREQSRNEKLKLVQMKNQINEKQAG